MKLPLIRQQKRVWVQRHSSTSDDPRVRLQQGRASPGHAPKRIMEVIVPAEPPADDVNMDMSEEEGEISPKGTTFLKTFSRCKRCLLFKNGANSVRTRTRLQWRLKRPQQPPPHAQICSSGFVLCG